MERVWFKRERVGGTGGRMRVTDEICSKCKARLYLTRLGMKLFCRECWVYRGNI